MFKKLIICAVIGFVALSAFAQPSIPRSQIPRGLSSDVRQALVSLYSSDPTERAKAAYGLDEFGVDAEKAIPFLAPGIFPASATPGVP